MRFQNQEHQLTRSRGVAVITSPCHGEDRGFDSRRDRCQAKVFKHLSLCQSKDIKTRRIPKDVVRRLIAEKARSPY